MKSVKYHLLIILFIVCTPIFAQKMKESKVPLQVKNALYVRYPDAKKVTWELETPNYEASFMMKGDEVSVLLSLTGVVLETEVEIAIGTLPSKIITYIKDNYKERKIQEAAKMTSDKGIVSYEVEIKNEDLIFDAAGNFLKSIKK